MADGTSNATAPAGAPPYADKKGIWSWMLFDWAAQPFHTLIITFVFAPYFASAAVSNESVAAFLSSIGLGFVFDATGAEKGAGGQALWGLITGTAGLMIAFTAPIFGSIADSTGPRKPWILGFGMLGVIACWFLWYAVPGMEDFSLVVFAIMLAIIGFEFVAVFNNAMLPDLLPRAQLGRLSGSAWGFGYLGGLATLVIVLGFLAGRPETGKTILGLDPLFGLDPNLREGDRISGPLTSIWFLVFVIPLFLFTPDAAKRGSINGAVSRGLKQLGATLRELPRQRSYFTFLISSMFYRDGLGALHAFGGIYAANVLNWSIVQIGIFGILANITGAIGAWFGGRMDELRGPRFVVSTSIVLLILSCVGVVSTTPNQVLFIELAGGGTQVPDLMFFVCGAMIGAAGGSLQGASRTLLIDQAPPSKITEGFGLYALSGKATIFIGPLAIFWATAATGSNRLGVTPVIALLLIGLVLLMWVKSKHKQA